MARVEKRLGATDGWISMPDGTTHYIFGFVDITGVPDNQIFEYRGKAVLPAPLLEVYENDELLLTLTNLGLPGRPDLDDTHTIHWHGFPNQIPIWDGVPEASISVPVGRNFIYYYRPLGPGTYMYHCHFEPVEHIQMGMVGPLTVRPMLEQDPGHTGRNFVFNDESTEYDRVLSILLTELDPVPHSMVAQVQEFDWTEYRPQYWLMNGRSYPDTVKPDDDNSLPLQPASSLVKADAGETILFRIANLGFQEHCLELLGLEFKVVGQDAMPLKGLHAEDLSYTSSGLCVGAGQTVDALVTVPSPGIYPLYNRSYNRNSVAGTSFGGMVTEIRVG